MIWPMRIARCLPVALLLFASSAIAQEEKPTWNSANAKAVQKFAERWWQARPQTRFTDWDLAPRLSKHYFDFQPPAGADLVEFLPTQSVEIDQ